MKRATSWVALFAICACSQSDPSIVTQFELIREADHLGEYLRATSPNEALTFNRKSNDPALLGLVKVNLRDKTLASLDRGATEARDLLLSFNHSAYRITSELKVFNLTEHKQVPLQVPAGSILKLRTFLATESEFSLGVDLGTGESKVFRFNKDGSFKSSTLLTGSPRIHRVLPNGLEILLLREPKRTALYQIEAQKVTELDVLQEGLTANYVDLEIFESDFGIAFFDDETGCLKWARIGFDGKLLATEVVDGEPKRTYRGLDIDTFNAGGTPIISYLDGWALKARIAKRQSDGKWIVHELPIKGAVGFYSQILSYQDGLLKLAFHNFRTDHEENRRQSFEDLAVVEVQIE